MSADKCRWFNKNGFALGTGECVLHRRVCGSGHKVCEQYEEYESRPHGEWIPKAVHNCWTRFECSVCGYYHEPVHYFGESKPNFNFCPNCGADMRKEGDEK